MAHCLHRYRLAPQARPPGPAPSDSLSDFSSTAWRSRYLPPGAVLVQ